MTDRNHTQPETEINSGTAAVCVRAFRESVASGQFKLTPKQHQRLRAVVAQLAEILAEDDRRRAAMGLKAEEDFEAMVLDINLPVAQTGETA